MLESLRLCFRCEHRARFLEKGHAPRCECKETDKAVCSCYAYKPVSPLVMVPNEGDPRPVGAGIMIAPRMHATRIAEGRVAIIKVKGGFLPLFVSNEPEAPKTRKRAIKRKAKSETSKASKR